eukprot:3834388-Rhodomonas_salina.3
MSVPEIPIRSLSTGNAVGGANTAKSKAINHNLRAGCTRSALDHIWFRQRSATRATPSVPGIAQVHGGDELKFVAGIAWRKRGTIH